MRTISACALCDKFNFEARLYINHKNGLNDVEYFCACSLDERNHNKDYYNYDYLKIKDYNLLEESPIGCNENLGNVVVTEHIGDNNNIVPDDKYPLSVITNIDRISLNKRTTQIADSGELKEWLLKDTIELKKETDDLIDIGIKNKRSKLSMP